MAKEINFYKVDKKTTEKDMTERFGQHLIRVEYNNNVYVVRMLQSDGKKLKYNDDAEELMELSEYIIKKTKELKNANKIHP